MKLTKVVAGLMTLLLVALCVSCANAGSRFKKEGYVVVRNRLRLGPRTIPYPTSKGVLKIAAEKGRLPADLVIHRFNVTSGSLIFHGKDGALKLLADNKAEVSKAGYETRGFTFRFPAVTMVLMDTEYEDSRQSIQFQRAILEAQDFPRSNTEGYWGISPALTSSVSNGYYLITIPYAVSSDFQGDMGVATLQSNWYDF